MQIQVNEKILPKLPPGSYAMFFKQGSQMAQSLPHLGWCGSLIDLFRRGLYRGVLFRHSRALFSSSFG
jgi:hypothetical protein